MTTEVYLSKAMSRALRAALGNNLARYSDGHAHVLQQQGCGHIMKEATELPQTLLQVNQPERMR